MDELTNVSEEVVDLQETEAEETAEQEEEVEETEQEEKEEPAEPPKQSAEVNRLMAEQRRKHDAEVKQLKDALEAERKAKSERINEVVQTAFKGAINPYTQKPIETEQDYQDYLDAYEEDRLQQAGLSKDYIEQMIANSPAVKQAQAILEIQSRQQAKVTVDLKLAEISKINPNIKTTKDLEDMPTRELFDEYYFKKGYDMVDAYKLANPEHSKKPSLAETKDHLIKLGGQEGSAPDKEIPASELAYWKESFPNDKPAELKARYNRALKRQGE